MSSAVHAVQCTSRGWKSRKYCLLDGKRQERRCSACILLMHLRIDSYEHIERNLVPSKSAVECRTCFLLFCRVSKSLIASHWVKLNNERAWFTANLAEHSWEKQCCVRERERKKENDDLVDFFDRNFFDNTRSSLPEFLTWARRW